MNAGQLALVFECSYKCFTRKNNHMKHPLSRLSLLSVVALIVAASIATAEEALRIAGGMGAGGENFEAHRGAEISEARFCDHPVSARWPTAKRIARRRLPRRLRPVPRSGGGRVVVPAGEFLTGAIHLKSDVNLHLEAKSVLKFSTDPKAYLPVVFTRFEGTELYNFSPLIYALGQKNVAVTGEGTLDGQADETNWLAWKASSRAREAGENGDGQCAGGTTAIWRSRPFAPELSSSSIAARMF